MWILVGQRLSQVCSLEMGSHEGKLDLNALASPVYVKGPVPWVSILTRMVLLGVWSNLVNKRKLSCTHFVFFISKQTQTLCFFDRHLTSLQGEVPSQYLNSRELAFSLVVLVSTKAKARTKKQSENLARLARQGPKELDQTRSKRRVTGELMISNWIFHLASTDWGSEMWSASQSFSIPGRAAVCAAAMPSAAGPGSYQLHIRT
jgi:hypothetical protein